jgi:hypothetical protein
MKAVQKESRHIHASLSANLATEVLEKECAVEEAAPILQPRERGGKRTEIINSKSGQDSKNPVKTEYTTADEHTTFLPTRSSR